jgi:hypothetical protein
MGISSKLLVIQRASITGTGNIIGSDAFLVAVHGAENAVSEEKANGAWL